MRKSRSRRKGTRHPAIAAVTGLALGSILAWWLVPATQRLRRRLLQLRPEGRGRSPLIEELSPAAEQVDDGTLLERVRSELRRVCSYPGALTVTCGDGAVHLAGPVLKSELTRVLRGVARVPGVREVYDDLEAHRYEWSEENGGGPHRVELSVT